MKKYLFLLLFLLPCFAFGQALQVQYLCFQTEPIIHKVKPQFKIVNNSTEDVPFSELTLRYYFSAEGYVESELSVDYAWIGNSNILGSFHEEYLQIDFASAAGVLAAGTDSGGIQLRIEKVSHGNYIQENDYSFDPSMTDWTPNMKVTLHRNGQLVWGELPPPPPEPTPPPPADDDWLHTEGSRICDINGNTVRLTGINWFGFETNPLGLGGLQGINWMETLDMLTEKGFNFLRLPLSCDIVRGWMAGEDPKVNFVSGLINPTIDGISSLQLLDRLMDYCKEVGLKIMLDIHTLDQTDIQKKVWYNASFTTEMWQEALVWLAERYKNDDTLLAIDIFNEPHGQGWVDGNKGAKWDGSNDPNNWRKAAEEAALLILEANPNLLIMVEGIESTTMEGVVYGDPDKYLYHCNWWGGNLREVKNFPIDLGVHSDQLVYSPHDYGPDIYVQPWFKQAFDINTLYEQCWQPNWFYLVEEDKNPILIGEWGGKLDGGDNQKWMESLAQFLDEQQLHHTFWCFNPDSHDTGGIVDEDFVFDQAKYDLIKRSLWKDGQGRFIGLDHQVSLSKTEAGTNVTEYYGTLPTPTPTPSILMGDANGDGSVNIVDALTTARKSVNLDTGNFIALQADVDNDGEITILDALLIARFSAGLITEF